MSRSKRTELEIQMNEFLANGGKIKQVGHSSPLTYSQFERYVAELDSAPIGQKEAENESNRHHAYYGE